MLETSTTVVRLSELFDATVYSLVRSQGWFPAGKETHKFKMTRLLWLTHRTLPINAIVVDAALLLLVSLL